MKKILTLAVGLGWILVAPVSWAGELVFGPQKFTIQSGKHLKEAVTFEVVNPNGTYWLRVDNGEAVPKVGGEEGAIEMINLVDGGRILLNEKAVARSPDFHHRQTKEFGFTKDVALLAVNALELELRGAVGSFITVQIRKAEPNVDVTNRDRDLSGLNSGDAINLWWSDDDRATEYIVFRGLTIKGAWEEIGRRPQDRPNAVDFTPDARLRDLCYLIEAVDANGKVVRRYDPICVPKFVEQQSQSSNRTLSPAKPGDIKTGKAKNNPSYPIIASLSLQSLASGPPINELCLDNQELTDPSLMTLKEIRTFLEGNRSFLQGQIADVDGVMIDPAQEISNAAQKFGINPQVLLGILQREQGAATARTRLQDRRLRRIMGWDPRDLVVPLTNKSIREQLRDGAAQLRRDFDRLSRGEPTGPPGAEGWEVGVEKMTTDGVLVTPATKASADMYAYNPEVGRLWGGGRLVGGNSDFCQWWERFGFGRPEPLVLNPQNPTLTCPDGSVTFTASGGTPPYTWETTKGAITPNGQKNENGTLTLGNNPDIFGLAYIQFSCQDFDTPFCHPTPCACNMFENRFGCGDQLLQSSFFCGGCGPAGLCGIALCEEICTASSCGQLVDRRTQTMIDAGCRPCILETQSGGTVRVTDSATPKASANTTVTVQ